MVSRSQVRRIVVLSELLSKYIYFDKLKMTDWVHFVITKKTKKNNNDSTYVEYMI